MMWVFCSGRDSERKMSLYYYHATRSGKVVEKILGDYSGYLHTDGYSAYNAAENTGRLLDTRKTEVHRMSAQRRE